MGEGDSSSSSDKPLVLSKLRGTIQYDTLKEFMVHNTYIYPPRQLLLRVNAYVIGYASFNMPLFNSVSVLEYHMQEAGADTALELVYTIANGLEYVRTAVEVANLKVDDVAPILLFFWGIGMNFYTKIAKMRAGRRMWAKLKKERYQPQNSKLLLLISHCKTYGYYLMECQPSNNVICATVEVMADFMGGT